MILDGFTQVLKLSDETAPDFNKDDSDDRIGFQFSLLIPTILIDRKKSNLEEVSVALIPALKDWYVEWFAIEG
jgi:hypothetical protein